MVFWMCTRMAALFAALVLVSPSAQAQDAPTEPPATTDAEAPADKDTQPPAEAPPAADAEVPAPPAPPTQLDLPTPPPGALPQTAATGGDEITLDEWERADWELVKPKVSLVELDGFFRLRSDMFRKMDFDNGAIWEQPTSPREGVEIARWPTNSNGRADYTGANMRLRIEPTLNATENIQIITTFDIFDNFSLGSTPNTIPASAGTPNNLAADSQAVPQQGINALGDSFQVKRAYARVTALNEQLALEFGRMPNNWGLGMLVNSGDCLDCDFGDVTDRLSVSLKAANHVFTPMYDWVSTGPVHEPFGRGGQPIDAATWDDVSQYSVQVTRADHPDTIAKKLLDGQTVLNYGLWNIYRQQSRDLPSTYYEGGYDPSLPMTLQEQAGDRRDAQLYTGDAWLRLYHGNIELDAEAALIWGEFKDGGTNKILKFGGALELHYRFDDEYRGTTLSLLAGGASGDSAPGFGALDRADSQRGTFGSDQTADRDLTNFQFSPDYHVDLLMFRRMVGTVTDAWYVAPQVSHAFDENVNGRLSAVYSQAMLRRSTASCMSRNIDDLALCREDQRGTGSLPMGLELNGEIAYGLLDSAEGGAFRASAMGGVLFPFGAFKNPELASGEQGGSFAWTLQWRLYVVF